MAEPYLIDTVRIKTMNDQLWRRVGVTQSFEILLVEAALLGPGIASEVARRASSKLSGGAARFWDLSIAQLQKDLCRRRILSLSDGTLQAHTDFAEKLDKVLADHDGAVSRVMPTPGVTTEQVLKEAEAQAKAAATRKTTSNKAKKAEPKPTRGSARPLKRQSQTSESSVGANHAPVKTKHVDTRRTILTPKQLFTSNRLNRLLDYLDDTTLSVNQLSSRLDLSGGNLDALLEATGELQITRVSRDRLVELHWRGRELVRTVSVDRRLAVLDLVKELREKANASVSEE
ncbi:MAG: hypothetical protein CMH52_10180 [Myxococcales bacterium]|nr:hypothetical protein [Myxococcales bacterium]